MAFFSAFHRVFPLFAASAFLIVNACYFPTRPSVAPEHARGSAELACPTEDTTVESLGAGGYVVRGCGREVRLTCRNHSYETPNLFSRGNTLHHEYLCEREGPPTQIAEAPPPSPPKGPSFDDAGARAALKAVDLAKCGGDGVAIFSVRFAPNGRVEHLELVDGDFEPDVLACVKKRLRKVNVPGFEGDARTVDVSIRLRSESAS